MEQMNRLLISTRLLSSGVGKSGGETLQNSQIAIDVGKFKSSHQGESVFLSLKICGLEGCHHPLRPVTKPSSHSLLLFAPNICFCLLHPHSPALIPIPSSAHQRLVHGICFSTSFYQLLMETLKDRLYYPIFRGKNLNNNLLPSYI